MKNRRYILIVVKIVVCAALLFSGCQESNKKPKGPDGKPLPGLPGGVAIPDPPYNLKGPNMVVYAILEQYALNDMANNPQKKEGEATALLEVEVPNPDPPPATVFKLVRTKVKWKRNEDGTFQITDTNGIEVVIKPTPDGKAETKTYLKSPPAIGIHYGKFYLFVGQENCQEAIWIQYIRRKFQFEDISGKKITPKPIGPEIDKKVPYAIQTLFPPGGSAMEDAPGYTMKLGEKAKDSAPTILGEMKKAAKVDNSKIRKVTEEWSFWTYLICIKPTYKVVGHYEWGFTIKVDVNNHPYVEVSDPRIPVWISGR